MKWIFLFITLISSQSFSIFGQQPVAFVEKSTDKEYRLPEYASSQIDFQLVRGMMYVRANLEQEEGLFIFDTGAPDLVLNSKPKPNSSLTANSYNTNVAIHELEVNQFEWADLKLKNIKAIGLSLDHLEYASCLEIDGLIGYPILRKHEWLINYQNNEIWMLPSKDNSLHKLQAPIAVIPFEIQGHLPVIQIVIQGKFYSFGIDTGSAVNLMDKKVPKFLDNSSYKYEKEYEIQGLDQKIQRTHSISIDNVEIDDLNIEGTSFLLSSFDYVNEESMLNIDGLLGYTFLKNFLFSIDYSRQKIYIWKTFSESTFSQIISLRDSASF